MMTPNGFLGARYETNSVKICFGCPHRARSHRDMEDNVSRLLLGGKTIQADVVQRVKQLAATINVTNCAFLNTKLPIRVSLFNVFSTVDDHVLRVSFDSFQSA